MSSKELYSDILKKLEALYSKRTQLKATLRPNELEEIADQIQDFEAIKLYLERSSSPRRFASNSMLGNV